MRVGGSESGWEWVRLGERMSVCVDECESIVNVLCIEHLQ